MMFGSELPVKTHAVFEVAEKDMLGRIGKLHTKSGVIETPCLFPVVHPSSQSVTPREMWEMGFRAVMTNAYLTRKALGPETDKSIHELLNFPGVVATDSGAYQILTYGEIEVTQAEIIEFQERIDSDIAVILDIPTGLTSNRRYAESTVTETIKRADQAIGTIKKSDTLWVGPIQGGTHPDLVARSAEAMANRPFPILALGSPTQVMEQYKYHQLLRMILTCKENIPPCRPLHLFGGGHPSMLALAVSSGCDLFDSASYAIYARKNRYLTTSGTVRLEDLEYLPCSCSVCRRTSPKDLADSPADERTRRLSIHNLNACLEEIQSIKQSIAEGRLWELVMQRVRAHPRLFESIHGLSEHLILFERHSPISKKKGMLFFDHLDLNRPEIFRFRHRIAMEYSPPGKARILLMLPRPLTKPFNSDSRMKKLMEHLSGSEVFHLCFYMVPFGLVPAELCDVYPVAQTESSNPPDPVTAQDSANAISSYLRNCRYGHVVLQASNEPWVRKVTSAVKNACLRTRQRLAISHCGTDSWSPEALEGLHSILDRIKKRGRDA